MPKKILLADDSVTIQKVVELTFAEGDYEVTCVSNGKAAIERLQASRPDILLCDIIMPEVSGYDVAQFVKRNPVYSAIPVILLTGTFEPFDEEKARLSGADTYITKPFDSRMLVEKVQSLLQSRLVMDATAPAPSFEVVARQEMTVRPQESMESPFSPAHKAPEPPTPEPEQPFEAAFEPEAKPEGPAHAAFAPAAEQLSQAAPRIFEAAAFEPEPPSQAEATPAREEELEAVPSMPPQPKVEPESAFEPAAAFQAEEPPKTMEEPAPSATHVEPQVMDVAMLGTQPVPESVFEGLVEAPAKEEPPRHAPASPEATLIASSAAFGEEVVLPEDIAPAPKPFAQEEAASEEPAASPAAAREAVKADQPQEPEMEKPAAFTEEPPGEMELESSSWLHDEAKAPEPVSHESGIVHDMTEQQEMVAEAQAFVPPPSKPETVIDEAPSSEHAAFWEEKLEAQPTAGESTLEAPRMEPAENTNPAIVAEHLATPPAEAPAAAAPAMTASTEQIEAIVRKVVEEMAPEILRQVAWEVIPELAESLIKRRIQELEAQAE